MDTHNQTFQNELTSFPACSIIKPNRGGWLICPNCRRKLMKVLPNTRAENLPVYCRTCKHSEIVNISSVPEP